MIPIDYYLTIDKNPLSVFQNVHLQLQPYYSVARTNQKVTLYDFSLLKCIGVGYFLDRAI